MNQSLRAPARAYSPDELREVLSSGLMSFPLTDFDAAGEVQEKGYRDRLEWLVPGRYRFTVGEASFEVGPGVAFVIPSGVTHGCRLLEGPGVLLDSFTPRRDDFL